MRETEWQLCLYADLRLQAVRLYSSLLASNPHTSCVHLGLQSSSSHRVVLPTTLQSCFVLQSCLLIPLQTCSIQLSWPQAVCLRSPVNCCHVRKGFPAQFLSSQDTYPWLLTFAFLTILIRHFQQTAVLKTSLSLVCRSSVLGLRQF